MRIEKFSVKNIGKLEDVEFNVEANTVVISGANGSGKTTALDSIARILGMKGIPLEPITKGKDTGREQITLDTGMVLTRKYRKNEKGVTVTAIEVEAPDMGKISKPATLLKGLTGSFLDPHKAMELSEQEQLKLFMDIVKVEFNFDEYASERKALFTDRTVEKRLLKKEEAILGTLPKPDETDIPVIIPVADLRESMVNATKVNQEIAEKNAYRASTEVLVAKRKGSLAELKAEIAKEELMYKQSIAELASLPPTRELVDVGIIIEEIKKAEETNKKASTIISRLGKVREVEEQVNKKKEDVKTLTKKIAALDEDRISVFSRANIPVKGLRIGSAGEDKPCILLDDIPLSQASTSKKIETWMRLLIFTNPKLKVVLVDRAESLDKENLALIGNIAKENGFSVWLTIVGGAESNNERQVLVFENGEKKNETKEA